MNPNDVNATSINAQLVRLDDEEFKRAVPVSDAELIAIAVADVDSKFPIDLASPLFASSQESDLPMWYMPAIPATRVRGWHRPVVVGLIVVLLALEALGLCSIFGQVVIG